MTVTMDVNQKNYLLGLLASLSEEARAFVLDELTLAKSRNAHGPSQAVQNAYWLDAPERRQPKRVKNAVAPGFRVFKIAAIKALREERGGSTYMLKDAKDQIDKWEAEGLFDAKFLQPEVR